MAKMAIRIRFMVGLLVLKMDRFGGGIDAGMVEYLPAAGNGFDGVFCFSNNRILSNDQKFSIDS
jgi:hypothetical protein